MTLGVPYDGLSKASIACKITRSWADEGLDEQGIGGDNPRIGGQRSRTLDGLQALVETFRTAHGVGKKVSRVVRRASWAALRVGQRPRTSQKIRVSLS